ncbi:MAG TPA: leucyl aminopeptidase [Actinomycetota bacterium]|nr:leucyl aminopeptidase [Actinomycetota bacterium]
MPRFDFKIAAPTEVPADLVVVPVYEGPTAAPGVREVGKGLAADVVALLKSNGIRGSFGDTFMIPALGPSRSAGVLVVGLGPKAEADADRIRRAAGKVAGRVSRYERVVSTLPQAATGPWRDSVQAFIEGLALGAYRFDRYKGKDDDSNGQKPKWRAVTVLGASRWDARAARAAIRRGEVFAEASAWARDLVNIPAIDATPDFLGKEARKMAREVGLTCKVWSKAELERGGFGGILGVGRGSENDPRFIELRYQGAAAGSKPVALSGKGVTFDSGGLSIKDAKGMEWMKADMAGAASVMGAMRAIGQLKPKVNVVAGIPSAENLPGGSAIRPGDVLRHRGGRTSEVLNTDAEGRLILADALAYLAEQKPRVIVDAATLTGACMVALGDDIWGVMGNDDAVIRDLIAAGEEAGEPGWELPLWKPYRKQIESQVADVKNIGNRYGGAITAALFLKEFVGDVPWAHMDIAGTAFSEKPGDYWPRGATGNPVRTLIRFVERQAARK